MFGLFGFKPPLTTRQRAELELLMRRIIQRIGEATVREAEMVCELGQLSLDLADEESLLLSAAAEVRRRMQLTDANVQLKIVRADSIDAAAVYMLGDPATILVADATLQDPLRSVVALAHEYSHHILLGDGETTRSNSDERLTDLIPICFGLGILQSHASSYFQSWTVGESNAFSASKMGYLNAEEIGYALALLTRCRGETAPDWMRRLRDDSRVTMKRAQRYFRDHERSGGQILFDAGQIPDLQSSQGRLLSWIQGDDPTFALAATWRLAGMDSFDTATIDVLLAATESSDRDVVPMAITLLAGTEHHDQRVVVQLTSLMGDRRPGVAIAAMRAAHALGIDLSDHVGEMTALLDDPSVDFAAVVHLIGQLGEQGQRADAAICKHLARSIRNLKDEKTDMLLRCLRSICTDPATTIGKLVPRMDQEEALRWLQRRH